MATRLVVIGGGRMGEALLAGLIEAGFAAADELAVVEKVDGRRKELEDRYPGLTVTADHAGPADGAVIAVKPGDVKTACIGLDAKRVLSIAAGVTIANVEAWLGDDTPVVRAMPNTPALVGAGAAAVSPGTHATQADLDWATELLSAVGTVVTVPEHLLDAVTGLSGSGPAYVFLVAEALIEAGVLAGLPRPTSETLAIQTLFGAAKLLAESGEPPETLRANVTSPGGTTAAGLRVLENHKTRAAFLEAVMAATERSRQLGQ